MNNIYSLNDINNKTKINEKLIQSLMQNYLEQNLKTTIDSEEFQENKKYQLHTYLLLDDLKDAIKLLNQNILNEYSLEINENDLLNHMINDFIDKFDKCKNNTELYYLIFKMETKQCDLSKFKINKSFYYNVLNLVDLNSNSNKLKIIREKRIKDSFFKETELPDFAIYVNGLPFFVVELKTLERTYKAAIKDYKSKKSYQHFLGCICSDVENTIILAAQNNKEYFWLNYGKHIKDNSNSLLDVLNELIIQKENLLFYFLYCCKIKGSEKKYIQNARIQQYFVAKEYFKIFKESKIKLENKQSIINKSYFKHHTRTGKTFSINLILNLLSNKFSNIYSKIFILAHDITTFINFDHEFNGEYFGNFNSIKSISSREEYSNIIKTLKNNKNKEIYLLNIQKMNLAKKTKNENNEVVLSVDNIYKNEDVLFIIDEVHTHQNLEDGYAYVRNATFPNASYITTTATPEMKEISKGKFQNITKDIFGKEVDNFTPNDAVKLKIVTKLQYKKFLWTTKIDKGDEYNKLIKTIEMLDDNIKEESIKKFLEDDSKLEKIYFDISKEICNCSEEKDSDKNIQKNDENIQKKYEIIKTVLENYDYYNKTLNNENLFNASHGKENVNFFIDEFRKKIKESINASYQSTKSTLEADLKRDLIPEKIDIIVDDMNFLKSTSKYNFTPKAFWVVSSVKEGIEILSKLKDKIDDIENKNQNTYKNYRFALDVSKFDYGDCDLDEEDTKTLLENISNLNQINGKYVKESSNLKRKSNALIDFETELDGSIDILIIVGKYLMGYDLDRLVKVYIDTNVNDYKRIIQIATRGSTIRDTKDVSFVLDLNLTKDTHILFNEALQLYNGDENYEEFILDDNVINEKLNILDNELNKITNFFINQIKLLHNEGTMYFNRLDGIKENKTILIDKKLNGTFTRILIDIGIYLSKVIENKNKEIDYNEYWKSIKLINKILKELTIPEYFIKENGGINYLEYIEALTKVNLAYFRFILNKESTGTEILSKSEIRCIIRDTFDLLSKDFDKEINGINDILKINKDNNYQTDLLECDVGDEHFISSLISLQTQLSKQNVSGTILDNIDKLMQTCTYNNTLVNKENNDLFKELEEIKQKQVFFIKEKCESKLNIYIVYLELKNKLKELNLTVNEQVIIKFAKEINKNIWTILNSHTYNYNKLSDKSEWVDNEQQLSKLSEDLFAKISDSDKILKDFNEIEENEIMPIYNKLNESIEIENNNDKEFEQKFLNKIFIKIFEKQRIYSDEAFNDFHTEK